MIFNSDGFVSDVVGFQEDGMKSTHSYMKYVGETIPNMTELSFCFRVKFLRGGYPTTLISYAAEDYDNEIHFSELVCYNCLFIFSKKECI